MSRARTDEDRTSWQLLTNHGLALVYLSTVPEARIRDLAGALGITERAAQRIVSQLVDERYLERKRVGRRNRYRLVRNARFRDPILGDTRIGTLIDALAPSDSDELR